MNVRDKPLPKFRAPSSELREANEVLAEEDKAYALRAHFDPATCFRPSERYKAAIQLVRNEAEKNSRCFMTTIR